MDGPLFNRNLSPVLDGPSLPSTGFRGLTSPEADGYEGLLPDNLAFLTRGSG
jgi:hypothetical protein